MDFTLRASLRLSKKSPAVILSLALNPGYI